MPSVAVKLYSVFFKLLLRHRLQSRTPSDGPEDPFGVSSRPEESVSPANPSFSSDGVATKDIHIDPLTSLSVRIFLPDPRPPTRGTHHRATNSYSSDPDDDPPRRLPRRNSFASPPSNGSTSPDRRTSYDPSSTYAGYLPTIEAVPRKGRGSGSGSNRKLPVIVQFHGGAFVSGSCDSVSNDIFCRRISKLCDAIVVAVGYRLAPESRYPAAFDDCFRVLGWLAKQANLAECSKSMGGKKTAGSGGGVDGRRSEMSIRHIVNTFGASSMVEPWLAAHADLSRCVLLGVSCGANIADFVARRAVEAGKLLDPVKVVAQVLMYPFFIGSVPTHSELKLANSYFYDKPMCLLAWKLFLPEEEFNLDHLAANPLIPGRGPPLKCMPPTLTVVAEHDWMRDRAIAYSAELRKVNVDAPVLEYKDAVHEFATLDMLLTTPQAQACAEDVAIWVKKYISTRGHELSY